MSLLSKLRIYADDIVSRRRYVSLYGKIDSTRIERNEKGRLMACWEVNGKYDPNSPEKSDGKPPALQDLQ